MKIQLLSDTHGSPYALHPEADVIAHTGDFGNGLAAMRQLQAACIVRNAHGYLKSRHIDIQGMNHAQHPHPIRTSPRLHSHPLLRATADVAVGGAIAVTFAITATTGIAGSSARRN